MNRHSLRVDVSAEVGHPGAEVAVSLVISDQAATTVTLVVAVPGGGYSRVYWDIDWPGDYTQAGYHARRGWAFAAVDHLGIGASSPLDPAVLTIELMARAFAAVSRHLAERLRTGMLADSIAPMMISRVIGAGQSMGGCVALVAQAQFRPFDAIAVMGYSASHAVLPRPGPDATLVDGELLGPDLAALAWCYHHDDVEAGLRCEDLQGGFPFRTRSVPAWGCPTIPPAALSIMAPGVVAADAARVAVPVFIGLGDRDVCPDATRESTCYPSSPEVTLTVIGGMAHMHNFAGSRHQLWRRLHEWGEGLGRR